MAKPRFPLLALLFMHVIPVPTPSPPFPYISLYPPCSFFTPPSFLITVHPSLSAYWVNYSIFSAFPAIVCMSNCSFRRYPLTLSLATLTSDRRRRMKGQLVQTDNLRKGDRSHYVGFFSCPCCIKSRVMQG